MQRASVSFEVTRFVSLPTDTLLSQPHFEYRFTGFVCHTVQILDNQQHAQPLNFCHYFVNRLRRPALKQSTTSGTLPAARHGMETRIVVSCADGGSAPFVRLLADISGNFGIQTREVTIVPHEVRRIMDDEDIGDNPGNKDDKDEKDETKDEILAAYGDGPPPLFLLRDPIRVFDEWKFDGRGKVEFFISCYRRLLKQAATINSKTVVFEQVVRNTLEESRDVCAWWGLQYPEHASRHANLDLSLPYRGVLTNLEREQVEERCCRLYLRHCGKEAVRLRNIFRKRTWFGFDLDDTLHEFRYAAGQASSAIIKSIAPRFMVPVSQMEEAYSRILKDKTRDAFTDGKPSRYYRKQRILALMGEFPDQWESIKDFAGEEFDDKYIEKLLDLYEKTLSESLRLKCGAFSLLAHLKQLRKKVAIFTEGPHDAQQRAIRALGVEDYVDYLATTGKLGVSKVDGLFQHVLTHREIDAGDLVYIGDSQQRDMEPALAAGIFCVHLDETGDMCLSSTPPRVTSLSKIEHLLML